MLPPKDLRRYRDLIDTWKRQLLNASANNGSRSTFSGSVPDGRSLWTTLSSFLVEVYEGRRTTGVNRKGSVSYDTSSLMAEAFANECSKLLKRGRRPLIFADTRPEAEHLRSVLLKNGINCIQWSQIANAKMQAHNQQMDGKCEYQVIVAVKSIEGQGVNMQHYADTILCRPTPGDLMEQMKGRIDRPGQSCTLLQCYVLFVEHSIEEVKYANTRLAGTFFREYIAPVASSYREILDFEAALCAGGSAPLKSNTVTNAWRKTLKEAAASGSISMTDRLDDNEKTLSSSKPSTKELANITHSQGKTQMMVKSNVENETQPKYAPLNQFHRNKGDRVAIRKAKEIARNQHSAVSEMTRNWLFPKLVNDSLTLPTQRVKSLPKETPLRYSDTKPPILLDSKTINKAVVHLSKDPKLGALLARLGSHGLKRNIGMVRELSQGALFDSLLRSITFTMISVEAGNSFLRKLAIKIGACLEIMEENGWVTHIC